MDPCINLFNKNDLRKKRLMCDSSFLLFTTFGSQIALPLSSGPALLSFSGHFIGINLDIYCSTGTIELRARPALACPAIGRGAARDGQAEGFRSRPEPRREPTQAPEGRDYTGVNFASFGRKDSGAKYDSEARTIGSDRIDARKTEGPRGFANAPGRCIQRPVLLWR